MVINGINHPLYWYFRRWKLRDVNAKEAIKDLSKKELIDKIIRDEVIIGASESRMGKLGENIENLQIQRDSLL